MNDFKEYSAAFHYQNNDLMHFGVKGMKWGVRRYQNKDGSLTPEGMKHYGSVKNAYEQMRKKELRRGLLYAPSLVAQGKNIYDLATGKYDPFKAFARTAVTSTAMIPDLIANARYQKFLNYYKDELGLDPKKIKVRVRGTDVRYKKKKIRKDGYKAHKYPLGAKKDGYHKHKLPSGTRSLR